jgi:23S rRNA-/tRNA-specific pseudouridylate synthase
MSEENSAPEESQEISEEHEGVDQEVSQEGGESADLEEVVQDALEQGASKKEVQSLIREFQLKVNGKTINRRIDLSDEAGLKNELQLAAAARSSMQDSANLKKLYEKEVGRLKSDPWAVLKELGMDPDELAELRIQSRIEEMKKRRSRRNFRKLETSLRS